MATDIFQKDIYPYDAKYTAIMGAVAMALKLLGHIDFLNDFQQKLKDIIKPN